MSLAKNYHEIFDKIYYVNLLADADKNEYFLKEIQKTELAGLCERFEAVDGRKIKIEDIGSDIITESARASIISQKQRVYGISLTYGSLGCALSHKKIWEECSQGNKPYLIFEDDIIVRPSFNNQFPKIIDKLQVLNFDLFYLAYNNIPGLRKTTIDAVITKPAGLITGTYGYIVSPKGAQKLLNIFPINKQIDSSISDNASKLDIYSATQKIIDVNTKFGSKTQRGESCINDNSQSDSLKKDNWYRLFV